MAFLDDMLRGNDVAPSPNRIIQGLKLAALLTERPEERIDRLSFLAREREGKHRVAQGEERNRLAREREERQQKESKRREEREDLRTRLELGAKGRRLSAEEREGLDTGELLGIDFGAGVKVGAGGMSRVPFGEDEYAIPGREAQGISRAQVGRGGICRVPPRRRGTGASGEACRVRSDGFDRSAPDHLSATASRYRSGAQASFGRPA